jgi:hypothetical protein
VNRTNSGATGKYDVRGVSQPDDLWTSWITQSRTSTEGVSVNSSNVSNSDEARRRVVDLVTRAEAIVEAMEATVIDGRWAMTAFSRYRLCEVLDITPYGPYDGDLDGEPVALLEEAVLAVDELDVPIEELSWRLALGDALRTAVADIRMVQDARDL